MTRILVVDDDFATRLLACEALEAEGFVTVEVESGNEALDKVAAEAPDAVLLDVNMPGLDGYEVCRRLRARPDGEDLSIMVMTATDDRDAVERAFAAGATDFMTKPLNLPLLGHRIRFMQRAADATAAAREAAKKTKRDELQILQLAFYDEVTGIPNARFAEQFLENFSTASTLSVIACDLGVSAVPRMSTSTRDALVRAATQRVLDAVRNGDDELRLDQLPCAPEGFGGRTFVARTGLDELTVVSVVDESPAITARQIARAMSVPFIFDGREVTLRPGFGVASFPDPVHAARDLYKDAVYALEQALRVAPRDIVVFGAVLRDRRSHREGLASRLHGALDDGDSGDLVARYTPRRDFARRLIGVRVAAEFVPLEDDRATLSVILASNPRIPQRMSRWALFRACRDAGKWLREGTALRVAVEVPSAVMLEGGFASHLLRAIEEAQFEPMLLDLELLEPPSIDADVARVAQIVATLRERGVRVTLGGIDEKFPLRGLTCLAVDGVRVDHGIVDHRGPRFLRTVYAIAKSLELRVAISGVDTPASMRNLLELDVDEMSGAELGEPVEAPRVTWLAAETIDARPVIQRTGWDTLSPSFTID